MRFSAASSWIKSPSLAIGLFALAGLYLLNFAEVEVIRVLRTVAVARQTSIVAGIGRDGQGISFARKAYPEREFVELDFEFQVANTDGHPNLFQTDLTNSGIRAEISGSFLGLVYPDEKAPSKVRGATLVTSLELGRWYRFHLDALDGSHITATVDGLKGFRTWSESPRFASNMLRVGIGFDNERRFRGEMRNIRLSTGQARELADAKSMLFWAKALLFCVFVGAVLVGGWRIAPTRVPPGGKRQTYYDPLLTLRALACFLVVTGHGMMIFYAPTNLKERVLAGDPVWLLTASPWGGVWMFFALSGYLMGKGFFTGRYRTDKAGVANFFRNRLLRIVPLYWISVLLVSVLVYPELLDSANVESLSRLMLFDYDGQQAVNPIGSLWSVSTEMQFYLLVPLIFAWVGGRISEGLRLDLCLGALLIAGVCFRYGMIETFGWELWTREVYKTLLGNLDLFLIGFFANEIVMRAKAKGVEVWFGIGLGLAILAGVYVVLSWLSGQGMIAGNETMKTVLLTFMPTVTAFLTIAAIVSFECSTIPTPASFPVRLLKYTEIFGLMTYAIYVWHEPVFEASRKVHLPTISFVAAFREFGFNVLVVFAVSIFAYYAIELPFERRKTLSARAQKG